eukprot:SAG31_NODE_2327_length_5934_cov_7.878835_3_plen_49_part_00
MVIKYSSLAYVSVGFKSSQKRIPVILKNIRGGIFFKITEMLICFDIQS